MNIANLTRMADHLEKVVHAQGLPFDIAFFRNGDETTHECNSAGDAIGHCTVLDEWDNIPKLSDGTIAFGEWSEKFTGLDPFGQKWHWCFSGDWENTDNTALGAAKRIRYLLEHGLPKNWGAQMLGEAPLCY